MSGLQHFSNNFSPCQHEIKLKKDDKTFKTFNPKLLLLPRALACEPQGRGARRSNRLHAIASQELVALTAPICPPRHLQYGVCQRWAERIWAAHAVYGTWRVHPGEQRFPLLRDCVSDGGANVISRVGEHKENLFALFFLFLWVSYRYELSLCSDCKKA